jgi:hypothetical protein
LIGVYITVVPLQAAAHYSAGDLAVDQQLNNIGSAGNNNNNQSL